MNEQNEPPTDATSSTDAEGESAPEAAGESPKAEASQSLFTRPWFVPLAVTLLALVCRAGYLYEIHDSVLTQIVFGDALSYDTWAQQIAAGNWFGDEVFYQAPAYPYFLALIYSLFGHDWTAVRVVQMILGSIACGLLAWATSSFFQAQLEDQQDARHRGAVAGLFAGWSLAAYPPAIFFDGIIQKASLGLFLLCALLACVGQLVERPRVAAAVAGGVLLALLALTRENALIFAPVLVGWLLWLPHRPTLPVKQRAGLAAMFVVGLCLVLLPVAARNASVGGGFALTTSQLGPNLYIGNGLDADGTYKPLVWGGGDALVERHDARRLAEAAEGRELTWPEVSDYWRDRTLDEIGEAPGRWFGLMVTKAGLLINNTEVADTEAQQVYEDQSTTLHLLNLSWSFGIVLAMAVFGIVLTSDRWRQLMPVYLLTASYAVAVVAFYVMARYRFPLAPLLMPFVAGGMMVVWESRHCQKALMPKMAIGTVAALIVGILAYLPMPQADAAEMRAVTYSNIANVLAQKPDATREDLEQAVSFYDDAIEALPGYAKAHNGRGIALVKLDETQAAFASYKNALDLKPDYSDAMFNLAVLRERSDAAAAERWYRKTIDTDPQYTEAYVNLGRLLAGQGRFAEAAPLYLKAIEIEPDNPTAHNNLGTMLARAGKLPQAVQAFRKAVELDPEYPEAQANLQRALRMLRASSGHS